MTLLRALKKYRLLYKTMSMHLRLLDHFVREWSGHGGVVAVDAILS